MTVSGSNRVIRGGSWINNARNCRSAYRNNADPGNRNDNLGLRLLSTRPLPERRVYGPCSRASGHVQVIILRRLWPDKTLCRAAFGRPVGYEDRRSPSSALCFRNRLGELRLIFLWGQP
jgi:hypothetical protein